MPKKKENFFLKNVILIILIIGIIVSSYLAYSYYKWAIYQNNRVYQVESEINSIRSQINELDSEINELNNELQTKDSKIFSQTIEISNLRDEIEEKKREIERLIIVVNELQKEIRTTKIKLDEKTRLYEIAKPYQERIERGQNLYLSYKLLDDYEDYAQPIILEYLGLSEPTIPRNDDELWERGRRVYNWLSDNYKYCGDRGLRVGDTFYEFEFSSPDEMLISDNERCGDCDNFAFLFSGLMYASGVPYDKTWVVCGLADGGGHCWNWLSLSSSNYRIDSVCSQSQDLFNFLGLRWGIKAAYYTNTKRNVDCFNEYNSMIKLNPTGFYTI